MVDAASNRGMEMLARIGLLGLVLVTVLAGPVAGRSGPTGKWGEIDGWQIRVDDGCFALRGVADGTVIRIGIKANTQSVYFYIGNDAWRSFVPGQLYPIRFVYDDETAFNGEIGAYPWLGKVVLGHRDVGPDFIESFTRSTTLRLFHRGTQIADFPLRDAAAAIRQVMACRDEWSAKSES